MAVKHSTVNNTTKGIISLLILIIVGLLVAVIILSVDKPQSDKVIKKIPKCSADTSKLRPKFYAKSNDLYRDLTKNEILRVRDYVLNEASLNVTPHEKASLDSNYIFLIELQNPDKDEAVSYLDANGPKPVRTANVVLFKGATSPAIVEEILVRFSEPMRHEGNTILTSRPIPFNARPANDIEINTFDEIINDFGAKAHKILNESYDGYTIRNCTDRCLTYNTAAQATIHRSGERRGWFWFTRSVPTQILHPVGLELLIERGGNDPSKWKIEKVYYSKTIFDSVDEFVDSYEQGKVAKVFLPAPTADERLFSTLKRRGRTPQP